MAVRRMCSAANAAIAAVFGSRQNEGDHGQRPAVIIELARRVLALVLAEACWTDCPAWRKACAARTVQYAELKDRETGGTQ